jgi:hypothetical protein
MRLGHRGVSADYSSYQRPKTNRLRFQMSLLRMASGAILNTSDIANLPDGLQGSGNAEVDKSVIHRNMYLG